MRTMRFAVWAGLAACGGSVQGGGASSGALLVSADGRSALVADADHGEVVRVDLISGALTACPVGAEPQRMAQVGDRVWVTLAAEGAVVALDITAEGCTEVGRVEVGSEPFGIVATADGSRLYVAVQGHGTVQELDGQTLLPLRKVAVPDRPRWLTLHPTRPMLYVGTAQGGAWFIDLSRGELVAEPVEVPEVSRGEPSTGEVSITIPRITGELVIHPDGGMVGIPMLYVDPFAPVDGGDPGRPPEQGGGGYASGQVDGGLTRFNPAAVLVPLRDGGAPRGKGARAVLVAADVSRPVAEGGQSVQDALAAARSFVGFSDGAVSGGGFGGAEPRMMDTGGFHEGGFRVDPSAFTVRGRGYVTALAFSPDGRALYAAIEGTGAVAVLPAEPAVAGQPSTFTDVTDPFFGLGGMTPSAQVFVRAGDGATALAMDASGTAWTWSFLDRTVHRVSPDAVDTVMEAAVDGMPAGSLSWHAAPVASLSPSLLPPDVVAGRRLFFSTSHPAMAQAGAGVSCATCHMDGANDGLTWQFAKGPRQTPSLRGRISDTVPVTWTDDVDSVRTEVHLTSQTRMGGSGLIDAQARSVAAFVDWTRPYTGDLRDADAIARGAAVFSRGDTQCATCHSGPKGTDGKSYAVHGLPKVDTPALEGVGWTAPYLHDGAAGTLEDLIDMADAIGMGRTAHLSSQERADLAAYLRSL